MLVKTFGCAIQGISATPITIEVVIFLYVVSLNLNNWQITF
jgi:hypothetical protein